MSLGSWLRDYLYVPLGGNRGSPLRTHLNLFMTFLVSGLWHGANWTYVTWGGLNGFYLVVERIVGIGREVPATPNTFVQWTARVVKSILTFHLVVVTFIVFPSPTLGHAFDYIWGLLAFRDVADVGLLPFVAGAAVFLLDVPQNATDDETVFLRLPWWVQSPVYSVLILAMLLFGDNDIPFIYFQF
jgi:D-alanyl-lipoteichoic acid acyltransferase DltB (MBOAT superfamily)